MSTSLSRHLFRTDEVVAALRYSIVNRRIEEGMFWTLELIDSEESWLLFETLFETWLLSVGAKRFALLAGFIKTAQKIVSSPGCCVDDLLLLAFSLLKLPRTCSDGSTAAIPILMAEELKSNRLNIQLEGLGINSQSGIQEAIRRGDVGAAARWLLRGSGSSSRSSSLPVSAERRQVQQALRTIPHLGGRYTAQPIWQLLATILELQALCLDAASWEESMTAGLPEHLSPAIQATIREWTALIGRRQRRIFAIPKWCLKWETARGALLYTESTAAELREPWYAMCGNPYWDRKAAEFGCASPADIEDPGWDGFVNFAFPDDIPDEWSAAARELSHGEGTAAPGRPPTAANWFRSWFPDNSYAIPGAFSKLNMILENMAATGTRMDEILSQLIALP
jgi:hypothetical protein